MVCFDVVVSLGVSSLNSSVAGLVARITHVWELEEQEMSIKFNRKLGGERLFLVPGGDGWFQERSQNRFILQF